MDDAKKKAGLVCQGCGTTFPSRNQLFKHLKDSDGACLDPKDAKYILSSKDDVKTVLLYGYVPHPPLINNGQDAARILLDTVQGESENGGSANSSTKINRSYGCDSRDGDMVRQDDNTGAITEVLAAKLRPLLKAVNVERWLDQTQEALNKKFPESNITPIRILGRMPMMHAKFNAETNVTHRRVEYMLPVGLLRLACAKMEEFSHQDLINELPVFEENHRHAVHRKGQTPAPHNPKFGKHFYALKKIMQSLTTQIVPVDMNNKNDVLEKEIHMKKRKNRPRRSKKKSRHNDDDSNNGKTDAEKSENDVVVTKNHRVLKRKRFHNFTPSLMAHSYMVYRRLDRIYHRATLRYPIPKTKEDTYPFLVLSMNGDIFLTGQVVRVVGLFIALANGLIDLDIVDCLFDEDYPELVPTPSAPAAGMIAREAFYMTFEGKIGAALTCRECNRYDKGWNQKETMARVKDWQKTAYEDIVSRWFAEGIDPETGRLRSEQSWTNDVLLPWVETAKKQLMEYRRWKISRESDTKPAASASDMAEHVTPIPMQITDVASSPPPPLTSMSFEDPAIRRLYATVLHYLQHADKSGLWPMTTLKRQLVMVSTNEEDLHDNGGPSESNRPDSLASAHRKAKQNKTARSSAYSYVEGQGGASGSFSVGAFPGGPTKQPKSNALFPELVEAAFELERKLLPNRTPSSTIAINRNAQFRPHCDSGAGAGQSTSLIVALGDFNGGELVVEGSDHDIRYTPLEFNGWKQRHWTKPFVGERYSLVWFTPLGCEELRGIDLDLSEFKEKSIAPPFVDADSDAVGASSS